MIILPPSVISYTLDLSEMIKEVENILRNVDIDTDITRWLNLEILHLSSVYEFPHYRSTGQITTVDQVQNYTFPTDFFWLKTIYDPSNQRRLKPIDEARLSWYDPQYRTLTGPVTHYILSGNNIDFYKIPIGVQVFPYAYQRRPLRLSSLTDICDLPSEWHPLITLGAAKRGLRREGRFDEIGEIKDDYAKMEKDLKKTVYRRPDTNYQFEGPEVNDFGPSRPSFPPNYPRVW